MTKIGEHCSDSQWLGCEHPGGIGPKGRVVLSRQYPTKSRVLVYNVPRAFAQYGMLPEAKMPCRERRLHEYSNDPSPKRFSPRQGMLRPPATSLNEDSRQPQCPEDQERAIVEALKHFKMNR